ncbi:citrate lyase holo-[acyl-carrier protein] synthase [Streptococcus ovuberis]|uniref:citrate lyase holo-[acyl-carrier protein] synthase n=1 Tax=Streptococcus ovuberis TaxID=1936207 RepID=A0A7X6S1Y4_9STRE|nr:citrate lyase holo-[acyl-carrier protein] synthase [Streptococcus ovuberis]NKZ20656.1 citrate lyase holo-[acyl-carrier protein] synthase [Streptococcus ovuberis]
MCKNIFDGKEVVLAEMLDAREKRAYRQRSLLERFTGASLLCATMNIPGPVKRSDVLAEVFERLIKEIEEQLSDKILFCKKLELETGDEYYLVSTLSPLDLKTVLVAIEDNSAYGRLVDLDVVELTDQQVTPISRTQLGLSPRTCYVCPAIAKECSRSRKHSVTEMQMAIAKLIRATGDFKTD